MSQAAVGANDLALWTGRLAYADPSWTVASRAAREARPARSLAQEPEDLSRVSHAVRRALDSMPCSPTLTASRCALRPTRGGSWWPLRPLPDAFDVALPFAPAPPERTDAILSLYGYAANASSEATAPLRDAVAAVQASGRRNSKDGQWSSWPSAAGGNGQDR